MTKAGGTGWRSLNPTSSEEPRHHPRTSLALCLSPGSSTEKDPHSGPTQCHLQPVCSLHTPPVSTSSVLLANR
ncbi:hypothetical protein ACRRTK_004888 [Alexandromys fortis]